MSRPFLRRRYHGTILVLVTRFIGTSGTLANQHIKVKDDENYEL